MSILSGKKVLLVGAEVEQARELKIALSDEQMIVEELSACQSMPVSEIARRNYNVILILHLHDDDVCTQLLRDLHSFRLTTTIPVLVLVHNTPDKIQKALMLGAADYLLKNESPLSIILKIKSLFGQPDTWSGSSVFAVPPDTAKTTAKGIRVFVVEDDPLLRNLLAVRLERSSFPHEFAVDGKDIIARMKQFKPQVVILDLMLPMKSGFEILAEMKGDRGLASLPVIVFSNRDSQEDKQRVFDLGADRFYVKAMTDLSVLIETIEELVAR